MFHNIKVGQPETKIRRIHGFGGIEKQNPTAEETIDNLKKIWSFRSYAVGFKFKFPAQFDTFPEIVNELKSGLPIRLVVLSRTNLIKQAVSRQNMRRLKTRFGAGSNLECQKDYPEIDHGRFIVDIADTISYARNSQKDEKRLVKEVGTLEQFGCSAMFVNYEEIVADQKAVTDKIFQFLGVPSVQVLGSKYKKATADDLSEAVENYQELCEAVSQTEFRDLLDR